MIDESSKKLNRQIFWLILISSVILRVGVAIALGDQVVVLPGIFDQISYHTLATRILGGYGFTFETRWWPLTAAGQPTAHWSYLYTLYLVAVYAIFGVHPLAARLIQAVLTGIFMPWFTYRLARQVFPTGPLLQIGQLKIDIPLLAMIWTTVYGYFIYYSAALMTETFYIVGILWIFDCALRISHQPPRIALWLELGVALGATILLRQLFLLFVPFLLLWLLITLRYHERSIGLSLSNTIFHWIKLGAISVLLLAFMIAPFTWLNYRHFGRFVLLNTNAGYAFFWANHPIHGNQFVSIFTPDMPSYQDLIPQELHGLDEAALDQELMRRGIDFVFQDPWRYVRLSISRIKDHFLFWPLPTSPLISNIVRACSFGLALPFMILGIASWLKNSYRTINNGILDWLASPGMLLFAFSLVYVAIHLLSWAGIRYRLPTDAVLLNFAANGLLTGYSFIRKKIGNC